ncbi:MAG: hypothetical protein WDN24_19215 [Sphingomonas sp.]
MNTLIILVHGDDAPDVRSDEYRFAAAVQRAVTGSAAVAILRPGHADRLGNRSPGDPGLGAGDSYDPARTAAIEGAVARIKAGYPKARVVMVGDDGGAAIVADLAGLRPGLFDGMVLVGCPCSLPEWRAHMAKRAAGAGWGAPVASLDPLKAAGGIAPDLRAAVLVGAQDAVTPVKLSRAYAEALVLRGIATDYRIVPGEGHDLLNHAEVLAATQRLAASLPRRN